MSYDTEHDGTEHEDSETRATTVAAERQASPKELYREQTIAEEYDSWGEGARREMFED